MKEIQEESIKAESQDRFSTNERKKYATELSEKLKQLKGANAKMNQQGLLHFSSSPCSTNFDCSTSLSSWLTAFIVADESLVAQVGIPRDVYT